MQKMLKCAVLACMLLGCGSDRPTSFQELIFGTWAAINDETTFRTIKIEQGSASPLAGTYEAEIVTGENNQGEASLATESGTVALSGSVIIFTRPGVPPQQFTWSIDDDVLTLRGGGFGVESYERE